MTESQLNGLAHLDIHRDIPVNRDRIIDKFSLKNAPQRFVVLLTKLTDNFVQTICLL